MRRGVEWDKQVRLGLSEPILCLYGCCGLPDARGTYGCLVLDDLTFLMCGEHAGPEGTWKGCPK